MTSKLISFILSLVMMLLSIFGIEIKKEDRTAKILASMTLEQKVGQMIMPAFRNWTENGSSSKVTAINPAIEGAIKKYCFGGIILFSENCQGTEQTLRLIDSLQNAAKENAVGIPMLMAVDQEGGHVVRLQTGTGTIGNMALGALNDSTQTKADASRMAEELSALGFNVNFGPDLDVNCNPSNPVIGIRSFSSSPDIAANMGKAYIEGMHEQNIATAVKHFPGHGDTATDSHTGLPLINKSMDELHETELIPFTAGVEAGTDLVMTAHIVFPQIETTTYTSTSTGKKINLPATLSKRIITGLLREELGYDGVVTTDSMGMAAISSNFTPSDAAMLAINAGVDLLLMPVSVTKEADISGLGTYINNIVYNVKRGKISEARINESVTRILKLKEKRGILEEETTPLAERIVRAKQIVGSENHYDEEIRTGVKAMTVLKNDGVLPLTASKTSMPVLFYPYAGEENSSAYAYNILKKSGTVPSDTTLPTYIYRNKTVNDYITQIKNASSVIVFAESSSAAAFNPSSSSGWQAVFIKALIAKAHELGKKVTVISLQLPYDAAAYTDADALMLAFGPKGMATVPTAFNGEVKLFGSNIPASVVAAFGGGTPQGRSPVDIYKLNPDYSYSGEILFPVGHGISY